MLSDNERIEQIKKFIRENPDTKITTSGLVVNMSGVKDEDEVRNLVEESDELYLERDILKIKES